MSEGILLGLALLMPMRSSLMICCTSDEPRRRVEPACELSESILSVVMCVQGSVLILSGDGCG
jgi:hypothetical protein